MTARVVVIDNGAGTCKVGFAGEAEPRKVFQNCSAKSKSSPTALLGDKLDDCRDIAGLTMRRPLDRGYLVDSHLQRLIWNSAFNSTLRVPPSACGLLLTEPLFNLPKIQEATDQIVFEEYGFQSFLPSPCAPLCIRYAAAQRPDLLVSQANSGLVVDAGFSFCHAVPVFDGRVLLSAVKRLNLGGKALTNFMKQTITYRSLDLRDETYLVDHIKAAVCFVSTNPRHDLVISRRLKKSPYVIDYVLPDGVHNMRGSVRPVADPRIPPGVVMPAAPGAPPPAEEQVLRLNNERFMIPEALFSPSDIGLEQAGLPEVAAQSLEAAHPAVRGVLAQNVLLVGGMAQCPGFRERFEADLRPLLPDSDALEVTLPVDAAVHTWKGGSSLGADFETFGHMATTKYEYEETGRVRRHAFA